MLLEESDIPAVKQWLLPKLELISNDSDASSDLVADYVIALVSKKGPIDVVKHCAAEALSEILQARAGPFIDEIIAGIQTKGWAAKTGHGIPTTPTVPNPPTVKVESTPVSLSQIPSARKPATHSHTSSAVIPTGPRFHGRDKQAFGRPLAPPKPIHTLRAPPTGPASQRIQTTALTRFNHIHDSRGGQSRKRKPEHDNLHNNHADWNRPAKRQTAGRGGHTPYQYGRTNGENTPFQGPSSLDAPNPQFTSAQSESFALPQIDFSDPASFASAVTNLLSTGLPALPSVPIGPGNSSESASNTRCRNYDTQGICFLGNMCLYDHSDAPLTGAASVPEYDPDHPSIDVQPTAAESTRSRFVSHDIPSDHPNKNRSFGNGTDNTRLVIEQIPKEYFSEHHVRQFFAQFGKINNVQLRDHNRMATVEFQNHEMAKRAYANPNIIFDNRFVQVYWYDPRSHAGQEYDSTEQGNGSRPTPRYRTVQVGNHSSEIDIPEIYRQDEDMIDHETFEKQQAEAQKVFQERQNKVNERNAEAMEVERKLQASQREIDALRRKLTEKVRAKGVEEVERREKEKNLSEAEMFDSLSSLRIEAEALFALGQQPKRNGHAADHGTQRGRNRLRCAVKRMDNRPRRLVIAGIEPGTENVHAARTYLQNTEGCEDVQSLTGHPSVLIAGFSERYLAEKFLGQATHVPGVSRLQLSWLPSSGQIQSLIALQGGFDRAKADGDFSEVHIKEEEVDLDVAEDADHWG